MEEPCLIGLTVPLVYLNAWTVDGECRVVAHTLDASQEEEVGSDITLLCRAIAHRDASFVLLHYHLPHDTALLTREDGDLRSPLTLSLD